MAQPKRKLAAILSADVVGYSRLMQDDEEATLATLKEYRVAVSRVINQHDGRIVNAPGDNILAEFPSAVEAVQAAVEIQRNIEGRNAELAHDRRMHFRVGVNLGDVLEDEDGTIYGDGVNIAARMEALAEDRGICISNTVYESVEGKVDFGFDFLGEQQVKNIAKPVRVYRVMAEGEAAPAAAQPEPKKSQLRPVLLTAAVAVVVIVAGIAIWQATRAPEEEEVAGAPADQTEDPILVLPTGPSIAVLPFENLSRDADQEYFADGIAEDLITELSRLRWLLVTARNSTFTYKGRAVDVKQVGRDLGVRYVVEGSVRRADNRVRISAQLIDATTGNHVWAERYDRELADIFALQDEITETLVAALQGEVGEFERERAHRKPPENLDAWESYQRGMWHLWRFNAKDMAEAGRLFQRAADLDPNFAQAFAALGFTLYLEVIFSYADSPLENLDQALRFANKAVALDDKEAMAHFALGMVQRLRGDYDAAIAELGTAIDLNPSLALGHFGLGHALMLTGQLDEAISEYDTAIRLSPRDPAVWGFYTLRAWARFLLGDYEAAVEDARRAVRHPAAAFWPHAHLASALALLGRREEAKIALDKLLEVKPDFTPDAAMAAHSPLNPEALRPLFKTWIEGLRMAGLDIPDEPAVDD